MIDTRVLDHDPETGVTEFLHYDDATDTFTIEPVQEVGDLLEFNKAAFIDSPDRWKGELHHVASIPLVILEDLERQGITRDPRAMRKWLNDRDNRMFRTRPGRV